MARSSDTEIVADEAVKLTSISDVEIFGAGGGNARSDNISSGRRI